MPRFVPRAAWLTVSATALIALAACSHAPPPPPPAPPPPPVVAPPAPPPPAPPPAPVATGDQGFIDQAAASNMAEISAGEAARSSSKSSAVRGFAARMVADHTRANNRLMALAKRLSMMPNPADTSPAPPSGSGPDFDRQYITDQISAHQQAISLFETEAQTGQNPQLKRFAAMTLPTLRHHLAMAESIAKRMGGM